MGLTVEVTFGRFEKLDEPPDYYDDKITHLKCSTFEKLLKRFIQFAVNNFQCQHRIFFLQSKDSPILLITFALNHQAAVAFVEILSGFCSF